MASFSLVRWNFSRQVGGFSHPNFPGLFIDSAGSIWSLVGQLSDRSLVGGRFLFQAGSLTAAFRWVSHNFEPVSEQEDIKPAVSNQLNFRQLAGLALFHGCYSWSLNKSGRYIKAYFQDQQRLNDFQAGANSKGAYALPNKNQYYTVAGCHYSAIAYF